MAHELGKTVMSFEAALLSQPSILTAAFENAKLSDAFLVINRIDSYQEANLDKLTELAAAIGTFTGVCVLVCEATIESQHRLHPLLRRLLRFNIHLESFNSRQRRQGSVVFAYCFLFSSCILMCFISLEATYTQSCSIVDRCQF